MRISLWPLCVATTLLLVPVKALPYNGPGHSFVGAISDELLEPGAALQVQLILGMSLADASNWADCVRSVEVSTGTTPTFTYKGKEQYRASCGVFETAQEQRRMEDFVRRNFTQCPGSSAKYPCHTTYHYTDIAIQHEAYARQDSSARPNDVVGVIEASLAVLQGQRAPKPFSIKDKREALLLLAHFVGDLHQPLHVGGVFLDANGVPVDPDVQAGSTETHGGNSLLTGFDGANLHADWDEISPLLDPAHPAQDLIRAARDVPVSAGDVSNWPAVWASESVAVARDAFAGLSFTPASGQPGRWETHVGDRGGYRSKVAHTQQQQLVLAGARLAQLLNAVLAPAYQKYQGYLSTYDALEPWLPSAPATPSSVLATDLQAYFETRRHAGTQRAIDASKDDVFGAVDVGARFGLILHKRMDLQTTPKLLNMMNRVTADASALIAPIKRDVAQGGRVRPLVAFPDEFHCPIKYAPLPTTGAYPSTHAAAGWLWGSILAELAPDKAGELLARGIEFGESRLICGFHYPSDIAAGRLAAAVVLVHLRQDRQFRKDFAAAADELARAPGLPAPNP